MIKLSLPVPPSVNKMFANRKAGNGRGRFKTKAYKEWIVDADSWLFPQKRRLRLWDGPTAGPIVLTIKVPANMRGDVSNRIKAIEDYLVSRRITADDRHNWKVSIERDQEATCCKIQVVPA